MQGFYENGYSFDHKGDIVGFDGTAQPVIPQYLFTQAPAFIPGPVVVSRPVDMTGPVVVPPPQPKKKGPGRPRKTPESPPEARVPKKRGRPVGSKDTTKRVAKKVVQEMSPERFKAHRASLKANREAKARQVATPSSSQDSVKSTPPAPRQVQQETILAPYLGAAEVGLVQDQVQAETFLPPQLDALDTENWVADAARQTVAELLASSLPVQPTLQNDAYLTPPYDPSLDTLLQPQPTYDSSSLEAQHVLPSSGLTFDLSDLDMSFFM